MSDASYPNLFVTRVSYMVFDKKVRITHHGLWLVSLLELVLRLGVSVKVMFGVRVRVRVSDA